MRSPGLSDGFGRRKEYSVWRIVRCSLLRLFIWEVGIMGSFLLLFCWRGYKGDKGRGMKHYRVSGIAYCG